MNNVFLTMNSFTKTIDIWNEKLNSFAATYMDSPWVGMVVFLVLLAFGFISINMFNKK